MVTPALQFRIGGMSDRFLGGSDPYLWLILRPNGKVFWVKKYRRPPPLARHDSPYLGASLVGLEVAAGGVCVRAIPFAAATALIPARLRKRLASAASALAR